MSFKSRSTDDLVRIVSAGGGVQLDAKSRLTDDLIRIAAAAKLSGAHVTFEGMSSRLTDDLVRIGAAGKGHVILKD